MQKGKIKKREIVEYVLKNTQRVVLGSMLSKFLRKVNFPVIFFPRNFVTFCEIAEKSN